MTEKERQEAFDYLHGYTVGKIMDVEDQCKRFKLNSMTNFTLIARDPNNDDMCLVVTNEEEGGLADAVRVALGNATQRVA